MQAFDPEHARLLASVMTNALAAGRWHTDRWTEGRVKLVQDALAIPVEDDGQIAMRAGIVFVHAGDLFMYAQGAFLDGSLAEPTALETRLLSPHRPKGFDDLVSDSVVEHDFTARPARHALAA